MPDPMVQFQNAFDKIIADNSGNSRLIERAILYILMPFLKIRTIAKCAGALGIGKDKLYGLLGRKNETAWLRLLRTFSYSRVIAILADAEGAYSAKQSRLRVTIGCDDSGFEKSGKRIPMVGLMWDHVLKRVRKGTQALYFFVIIGDNHLQFPLDLRLCRGRGGKGRRGRPSAKKTKLAADMLRDFAAAAAAAGVSLNRIVFTADSWFVGHELFEACRQAGITVLMKGKDNLVFTIGGVKRTGKELREMGHAWRRYAGESGYVYARYIAVSPSLGTVVLTVVKEENKICYLIGSNPDHTSPKMISDYKLRWSIEVFFRDSKQTLYLGEFRFQSKVRIIAHFVLRAISYHFADWIRRWKFRGAKTIGECGEYLKNNVLMKLPRRKGKIGIHTAVQNCVCFIKG